MDNMTVNSVDAYSRTAAVAEQETATKAETTTAAKADTKEDVAAVYEKSTETKKDSANTIYNRDSIVNKLKVDQRNRITSMQTLVEKLLNKQKGSFDLANATNLAGTFRQATALATPDQIAQAQKDVAEDGYWGVEQTSDRLVSMAIALSGGDTEKADEMKAAITKGFEKATAAWGEELPQISQDTYDAAMRKMDDWKNGVTTAEDYARYLS